MEVQYIHYVGREGLNGFLENYSRDLNNGKIKPQVGSLTSIDGFRAEKDRVIVASTHSRILGLLHSTPIDFSVPEGICEILGPLRGRLYIHGGEVDPLTFTREFSRYVFGLPSAQHVFSLESFVRGHGRKLIEELQVTNSQVPISLFSLRDARGFYDKLGFKDTGFATTSKDGELMPFLLKQPTF